MAIMPLNLLLGWRVYIYCAKTCQNYYLFGWYILRGCSWWRLVVITDYSVLSTHWKVPPVFNLNCLLLFSWHCYLPEFQGIHSFLWTTLHLGVNMNLFAVHICYFLKTLKFTHRKLTFWWILGSGVRLPGLKFLIYHLLSFVTLSNLLNLPVPRLSHL